VILAVRKINVVFSDTFDIQERSVRRKSEEVLCGGGPYKSSGGGTLRKGRNCFSVSYLSKSQHLSPVSDSEREDLFVRRML
jgi:hypothetical protein